ncbi:MAG: tetratricopeptide repeat protein [Phycisphaerae bacterium]|nr:tetratricopeptide repeat protein [Phycisphaerae bacterium]
MKKTSLRTSYSKFTRNACLLLITGMSICVSVQAETDAPLSYQAAGLDKFELQIWNSSEFKKRFTESYIAEVEIEPRVTADEREQMQKVFELISSAKMDEAIKKLEKLRNEAASAVYDFTLANIYFQQEKLDEAAAAYQIAVEKYPKFRRAWKNLGLIYVRKGEFEKALPAMTRVVELGGGDAITYGLLGYAYSSVENNLSAESAYRMAILLDPATLDWKMGLARSLFKQERFAEAITLCGQLIKDQPEQANLWLLQANAFIGLNKPLKAAEIYELVDQLGQSTVDSLNTLGDIYINEELYDMAVQSYIRAMEKPQGKASRAIRAAKVLCARGAYEETRKLVEYMETSKDEQIKDEDRKDLLKIRARLAVANGSGDEEISVLEQVVELDPLDGEALILLGQHSARKGDIEKAIFYYERAASIEKYEADAKVRQAQLLVGSGKYAEAIPLLQRAQQIKPRDNVQSYLEQVLRVAKTQ